MGQEIIVKMTLMKELINFNIIKMCKVPINLSQNEHIKVGLLHLTAYRNFFVCLTKK
jgi:hypothetical protein